MNRKIVKFTSVRFHGSAQILNKALTVVTPSTHPGITVRETPSGDYEFVEFDKKRGVNKVEWVPVTTIQSIQYDEDPAVNEKLISNA